MRIKRNKEAGGRTAVRMGAMLLALLFAVSFPITARANYRKEEADAVEEPDYETSVVQESEEASEQSPFSVPGNAQLLDDAKNDETKEFLTVQTKNNQTFFVVIDRANTADNVYMLSMIDEDDLKEFLTEEEEEPGLELPEKEEPPTEEDPFEEEVARREQEQIQGSNEMRKGAAVFVCGLLLAGAAFCGGYYYFKFYRPRKEEEEAEDEELETYDGRPYGWDEPELEKQESDPEYPGEFDPDGSADPVEILDDEDFE